MNIKVIVFSNTRKGTTSTCFTIKQTRQGEKGAFVNSKVV